MKQFVGFCSLNIPDEARNISFPTLLFYPTDTPSQSTSIGPYTIDVSTDAAISESSLPLVIISHGGGSHPLVFRTLAMYLAANGYIVALPEHYGNNRTNNSLEYDIKNLEYRPRHIGLVIDTIAKNGRFASAIQINNVAVIGHSMGGYTALAAAGGQPWWGVGQPVQVRSDARVKALVLMAPATIWMTPNESLRKVTLPILLFAAEHDAITPRWQAYLVEDLVPDKKQVMLRYIENAGHFSFLSPFPDSMKRPGFIPALDPPGFDRDRFQETLKKDVLEFLDRMLRG